MYFLNTVLLISDAQQTQLQFCSINNLSRTHFVRFLPQLVLNLTITAVPYIVFSLIQVNKRRFLKFLRWILKPVSIFFC